MGCSIFEVFEIFVEYYRTVANQYCRLFFKMLIGFNIQYDNGSY